MRLYIIRHGETPWNTQLRLQGQTDIGLNENGRALAAKTAQALREVPFDLAITSPLIRAKETAQILMGDRKIPLIEDARIQEINFGELEGVQLTNEERNTPGNEFYNFFHAPQQYRPQKGGESLDSLCARTAAFLEELRSDAQEEGNGRRSLVSGALGEDGARRNLTVLISTHGAASRALLSSIKGTPRNFFWEQGVPKNCAVTVVDLEQGRWVIQKQDVVYY